MTEISIYNILRAVTAKAGKHKLWFLCFTCCLMVVNISVQSDAYLAQFSSRNEYMTKITIYTVQRTITPEVGKLQL